MSRRAVIALLWFAAITVAYEVVSSLTGVPRSVGPIIAAAVAGAITIDSPGLFRAPTGSGMSGAGGTSPQVSPEG